MLPLYWGIIDIAGETNRPIIPLVLEYRERDCYAKFGTPIYVAQADPKRDKIRELSEKMATLKWELWELFPMTSRQELDESEWEREKQRRLAEYPKLDYDYEKSVILNTGNMQEAYDDNL